ncbi:ABC transporter ATP-binding protein [Acetohalobium arabaticum]|uniref:ABC transporter related protein n=1 Tax=Acetohalobium arabaticum (strain ATCC 49924 / DSM 5501 / Z-7288) TaxID=574087 RepID=D9QT14_ACEAZ|nr:ABC transporter ATP-binding protein [Acetohalobium arabaticum]ADL13514.1 ABC transporter related protein [Acetohalobium arabaticum DSM 5501]
MTENELLQIKDLDLILDDTVILKDLSLTVNAGQVYALIGPNGCGKSSLAYTLMGLDGYSPSNGEVLFKGEDITDLATQERAQKGITLAWQQPARFEGVKVRKFLALGLESQGREVTEQQLRWALNEVAINPDRYLDREVDDTLSGGERKRIELASILLMDPDLVILDEPDSGVDVIALNNISQVINSFRAQGTGVVLITHSDEMLDLADTAALVCGGNIVRRGQPQQIAAYFKDDCSPCGDNECLVEVAANDR